MYVYNLYFLEQRGIFIHKTTAMNKESFNHKKNLVHFTNNYKEKQSNTKLNIKYY